MKGRNLSFLLGIIAPVAALAANEGVPAYYQTHASDNANRAAYGEYAAAGYTKYVGQSGNKQIVNSRSYTYQVPRPVVPKIERGAMTVNGIAVPEESKTSIFAGYTRRFADFEFETGVNSILEWDDMVFNEITVGAQHNFSLRDFDLFAYGRYSYGTLAHGGLSMDYDLKPFDAAYPAEGIFTISMGDQSGKSHHFRFGMGAHHVWDLGGWKISPSIGYEIFKHDLEMSDHLYPNQGVYIPLLTDKGDYVFGDALGNYYTVPIDYTGIPEDWYQVCASPEDIKLVQTSMSGLGSLGTDLTVGDYDPIMDTVPWGVPSGECVIIGGDGPIKVGGTTHIYNTTWSGFYVGLEIEKQMTLSDKLRFYMQFGLPHYSAEGIWPNRTDWQQNPSFLDEGDNGAYSYAAEMEYTMQVSNRLKLSLRADTNYFHIGKIGGELYVAEYTQVVVDEFGNPVIEKDNAGNDVFVLETVPAHTEKISDSLKRAAWQSFGLHIGVKYAF